MLGILFDFSILHIVCYPTKNRETEEISVSTFLEASETGWCDSLNVS